MKSSPLVLNSVADNGRRLLRVHSEPNDPKNEAWLQELIYAHPELLPVDEFDDAYAPPIPIGREVGTDRGPIDDLFVSPEGGIVVVETKLWKNPEKHRTVVAQVIDYAKELATWDYDRLCEAVLAASRRRGETVASLEEKVGSALAAAGTDLHEFQENVATCLAEGNFLLLIVGDRISPNIALLTKAIQFAPGLGFRLGLVEMQLYSYEPGKDWPLIVVPEVVGRTVEKTRGVVRVRYSQERPHVEVEVDDETTEEAATKQLDLDEFLRQVPKDLAAPFREGVQQWQNVGGNIHFTNKMMHFQLEVGGVQRRIVRCRTRQVSIVQRKALATWVDKAELYDEYLRNLEDSAVLLRYAREGRQWITYAKLSGDDLTVLLRVACELAKGLADE